MGEPFLGKQNLLNESSGTVVACHQWKCQREKNLRNIKLRDYFDETRKERILHESRKVSIPMSQEQKPIYSQKALIKLNILRV